MGVDHVLVEFIQKEPNMHVDCCSRAYVSIDPRPRPQEAAVTADLQSLILAWQSRHAKVVLPWPTNQIRASIIRQQPEDQSTITSSSESQKCLPRNVRVLNIISSLSFRRQGSKTSF